ncbi:MAG TPA: YicC/YloC family endoribonuclease [Bacteroidales bacterium]|nr:YicC/YloC family endoribonuclease [Bacteroidales bacterium]
MIKSMTGFGKSSLDLTDKSISVEIKSLNSKQFDAYLRLPQLYREKEAELRLILNAGLERGKIEMNINVDANGDTSHYVFNRNLARQYYDEIKALGQELDIDPGKDLVPILVRMPDVLKAEQPELTEEEWNSVARVVSEAIEKLNAFRTQEGITLGRDLSERVHKIGKLLKEVEPFEENRIKILRERIYRQVEDAVPQGSIDMNRFEQEVVYYLEKLDITEEKVRLAKHCQYFLDTLNEEGNNGKKLGFISQEMGREINTLGSKANDADMQKIVVLMKDELEKIKEQLYNIL